MNSNYSFLISVYGKDNPTWLDSSLESLVKQTLAPSEVVLVIDGPVSETIETVIAKYCNAFPFIKILRLKTNGGLGKALSAGLAACRFDIVLRADADDISSLKRAENQVSFLIDNNLDVCSTPVYLFSESPNIIDGVRRVPIEENQIKRKIRTTSPFNHPSVAFKKSSVLKAGGYKDLPFCEDYFLWIRMYECGCTLGNMELPLVNMRISRSTIGRRSDRQAIISRNYINSYMLEHGLLSYPVYLRNKCENFCRLHLPSPIKRAIFAMKWKIKR